MKQYKAIYEAKGKIISDEIFEAVNISEAKKSAQLHKRKCPEIKKGRNVKTTVILNKY